MAAPEPGLVSIVMTAFDEEAFIEEAIESVLAQTYRGFELIVVDDGSLDRTAAIAAGFDRVRLVRRASRGGVGAARNTGLAEARGEYWTIFDADDVMPARRLELGVAWLEANPSLGMVLGLTQAFVTAGGPQPSNWNPAWDVGPHRGCPGTTIARREVLDLVGPYDEQLPTSEDVDWMARAKDAGVQAGRIDEVVLHHRIHDGSNSSDNVQNTAVLLRVLRESLHRQRGSRVAD